MLFERQANYTDPTMLRGHSLIPFDSKFIESSKPSESRRKNPIESKAVG